MRRIPRVLLASALAAFLLTACTGSTPPSNPPDTSRTGGSRPPGTGGGAVNQPGTGGAVTTPGTGGSETPPGTGGTSPSSPIDAAPLPEAGSSTDVPPGPGEIKLLDRVRVSGVNNDGKDQHAQAKFDLGPGPFAEVRVTISLDTTCYPFERARMDPPPAGQRWPPKCDAFDRRFEILLDPPTQPGGRPAIELVRAITPFGGPMQFEADITDVMNGLPGPHTFEAYIDTWPDRAGQVSGSDGGWFVTATINAKPGKAPRDVLAVVPLYYDSQKTPDVGPLPFTVPPGATKTRIEYRTTGHTLASGPTDPGCNGPPEEFCRRMHTLTVDGMMPDAFSPYRTDCASVCTLVTVPGSTQMYCRENPRGAIPSVRAPRANWCPGTVTPPRVLERTLTPGEHQLSWQVSRIQSGGIWRTSAVAIVYR